MFSSKRVKMLLFLIKSLIHLQCNFEHSRDNSNFTFFHVDKFLYCLFNGISFNLIPIDVGYLFAAHDSIITYELYQFQKQYMYYDSTVSYDARNGMNGVAWVFFNIVMLVFTSLLLTRKELGAGFSP